VCYCFKDSAAIPDLWTNVISPQLPMLEFVQFDYQLAANGTRVSAMPAWPTVWHLSTFQFNSSSGKPKTIVVEVLEKGIL
jgi:hypothetical protein